MTVTVFNSSMMEFVAQQSHPLFGGNGTRVVATTRHTWADSPAGLQLRTQMLLGLMACGSRDKFDLSLLATPVNAVIKKVYLVSQKLRLTWVLLLLGPAQRLRCRRIQSFKPCSTCYSTIE
jgi:hypothetical protein